MKTALFYYSITGNTRLVCTYIQKRIPGIELHDITKNQKPRPGNFNIAGFASPVFYLEIPPIVSDFIKTLDQENAKPAFILTTYGMMQGRAIDLIGKALKNKGYIIIDYHALSMPESYPPFIAKGWTDTNAPGQKEMLLLENYIASVKKSIEKIKSGEKPINKKIKNGFFNSIIPAPSHTKIMKQFGRLIVNEKACDSCGTCKDSCVYNAISLMDKPIFDMNKCFACFACCNKCPQKAIITSEYKILAQYQLPAGNLEEKFI